MANGATGIAVGMATSIPPHNIRAPDAMLKLIDYPDMSVEELSHFIPGPDFPTGGIIIEDQKPLLQYMKRKDYSGQRRMGKRAIG